MGKRLGELKIIRYSHFITLNRLQASVIITLPKPQAMPLPIKPDTGDNDAAQPVGGLLPSRRLRNPQGVKLKRTFVFNGNKLEVPSFDPGKENLLPFREGNPKELPCFHFASNRVIKGDGVRHFKGGKRRHPLLNQTAFFPNEVDGIRRTGF